MPSSNQAEEASRQVLTDLERFIEEAVTRNERRDRRQAQSSGQVPLATPPVSYEYHVLASDWTGSRAAFEAHGDDFRSLGREYPLRLLWPMRSDLA